MKIRFHFLPFMTYILINLIHLILYSIELVTIMLIGKVSLAILYMHVRTFMLKLKLTSMLEIIGSMHPHVRVKRGLRNKCVYNNRVYVHQLCCIS